MIEKRSISGILSVIARWGLLKLPVTLSLLIRCSKKTPGGRPSQQNGKSELLPGYHFLAGSTQTPSQFEITFSLPLLLELVILPLLGLRPLLENARR